MLHREEIKKPIFCQADGIPGAPGGYAQFGARYLKAAADVVRPEAIEKMPDAASPTGLTKRFILPTLNICEQCGKLQP
jgi:hypothetical protein